MDRHIVIGTAGHIDHGKTALVRALTGVDTDRLAEEKARGITIDLGFAPLALEGTPASVVDVPGHEGFIRNMVAGATGVDLALLVVAADEGIMPQTREHVAILRLLGVERGVVALTKVDLAAEPEWRAMVADDTRALLREELGAAWPVVEVSALRGDGLDTLRTALAEAAAGVAPRAEGDHFRLPVDRVFALAGAGTIVTGTVWSGAAAEGERVTILPAGKVVRLRSVRVHDQPVPRAAPGRRAALALVGAERAEVVRGDVVVAGEGWRASLLFDADVATVAGAPELRHRQRVRVHHGTAAVSARIVRLGERTARGQAMRIALESPLVLRAADRFVLRAWSPVTTIGGGIVGEPWADWLPPVRKGRALPAPFAADPDDRVPGLVRRRGPRGMSREDLEVAAGLPADRLAAALATAAARGLASVNDWWVDGGEVDRAAERLGAALDRWHRDHPLEPGMPAQSWRAAGSDVTALADLAEARLATDVVRDGGLVRRRGFEPGESAASRAGQRQLVAALREAAGEPPSVAELATRFPGVDVPAILRLLARRGDVIAVAPDRYYETTALSAERDRLIAALRALGGVAAPADLREPLGRSRKWLIPLLEWSDREGITVREGDRRRLRIRADA